MRKPKVFHDNLWDKLRAVQALGFCDKCKILVFSETYDRIGNTIEEFTATTYEIPCRKYTSLSEATGGYEVLGQTEVERNDSWVALPLTTVVKVQDRIRFTELHNADITPQKDWEVASPITQMATALLVRIRPVDDYLTIPS